MKQLNILFAFILTFLASCVNDEIDCVSNAGLSAVKGIHIIGAVEDFDMKMVRTRAEGDDQPADSYITEMTMFIFDKEGNIVQGYSDRTVNSVDAEGNPTSVTFNDNDKCSSAINIRKANPTFVIDTKGGYIASLDDASPLIIYYNNLDNTDDLTECKIYIVANAWHELEPKLDDISKLDDLKAITIAIDGTLAMPKNEDGYYRGFPMIGTHANQTFNLKKEGKNEGAVAKIPLKKLYSKVRFTMQVNANQVVVGGQTPKFQIKKVEVFNVPTMARLGRELDNNGKPKYEETTEDDYIMEVAEGSITESNLDTYYQFTNTGLSEEGKFSITDFNKTTVYHSASATTSDIIEFGFYMPEHKVTPAKNESTYSYPANLPVNMRQNYKPMLVGATRNDDGTTTNAKLATFVRIHGTYTDHNGQIKEVRYDIYLGQNNTDDFTIKRNQLLNNKLVITGLSNYHDAYGSGASNVSIDHRVDVDYKGFNLSVEREAILDSHFEVRPLDVELSPGSTMIITIPEEYRSWLAMEDDAKARETNNQTLYINTITERKGVRKYFTTNLVSELTEANNGRIQIVHNGEQSKIFRIWFYIDENTNVYDKLLGADGGITSSPSDGYTVSGETMYRNCPVKFEYYGTDNENIGGGPATVSETVTVNFQQWNLWRVWNTERTHYYDIEHEEEYLNIYASDQNYGETQDGIPWGLDGVQLSNEHQSFTIDEDNSSWQDYMDNNPQIATYDFYTWEQDSLVMKKAGIIDREADDRWHGYAGQHFTEVIFTKSQNKSEKVNVLAMGDPASGAVEYCYNRNKRNPDGSIAKVEWYLPSAGELEEIIVAGYSSFKEFQDNYYWTSQPAYTRNAFYYEYKEPGGFLGLGTETTDTYGFVVYEDNTRYARATKVNSLGNDRFEAAKSGLNDEPNEKGTFNSAVYNSGTPTDTLGYFKTWYQWKRDRNGNIVTTPQKTDQWYWDMKDETATNRLYYAFVNENYFNPDNNFGMLQEGYQKRTKSNRVRCVRKL